MAVGHQNFNQLAGFIYEDVVGDFGRFHWREHGGRSLSVLRRVVICFLLPPRVYFCHTDLRFLQRYPLLANRSKGRLAIADVTVADPIRAFFHQCIKCVFGDAITHVPRQLRVFGDERLDQHTIGVAVSQRQVDAENVLKQIETAAPLDPRETGEGGGNFLEPMGMTHAFVERLHIVVTDFNQCLPGLGITAAQCRPIR